MQNNIVVKIVNVKTNYSFVSPLTSGILTTRMVTSLALVEAQGLPQLLQLLLRDKAAAWGVLPEDMSGLSSAAEYVRYHELDEQQEQLNNAEFARKVYLQ